MSNTVRKMVFVFELFCIAWFAGCAPVGQGTPKATMRKLQRSIIENDYRAYLECSYPKGWKWNKAHKHNFDAKRSAHALRVAILARHGEDGLKRYENAAEDDTVCIFSSFPKDYSWIEKLTEQSESDDDDDEDEDEDIPFFDDNTPSFDATITLSLGYEESDRFPYSTMCTFWHLIKKNGVWYVPIFGWHDDNDDDLLEDFKDDRRYLTVGQNITAEIMQKGLSPEDAYAKMRDENLKIYHPNQDPADVLVHPDKTQPGATADGGELKFNLTIKREGPDKKISVVIKTKHDFTKPINSKVQKIRTDWREPKKVDLLRQKDADGEWEDRDSRDILQAFNKAAKSGGDLGPKFNMKRRKPTGQVVELLFVHYSYRWNRLNRIRKNAKTTGKDAAGKPFSPGEDRWIPQFGISASVVRAEQYRVQERRFSLKPNRAEIILKRKPRVVEESDIDWGGAKWVDDFGYRFIEVISDKFFYEWPNMKKGQGYLSIKDVREDTGAYFHMSGLPKYRWFLVGNDRQHILPAFTAPSEDSIRSAK